MSECTVVFLPQNSTVKVPKGTSLLVAASQAQITINNLCGGEGVCGRCKMIVRDGKVSGEVTGKLSRDQIRDGYVLSCLTRVESDLTVEIPTETMAKEKILADEDAERFRDFRQVEHFKQYTPAPIVAKVYLELEKPSLANNWADQERVCSNVSKLLHYRHMQMGLKIIQTLPEILRNGDYKVTATVGLRRDIAEVMNIESGDTSDRNYMAVVDMGTTTVVAHLVNANTTETLDARACFNSQGMYGREVTARMITAEKKGVEELQKLLIDDINGLIRGLAADNEVNLKDITAVVCAGNTAMAHFLLGLPTYNIRREPYISASLTPPPLRAAEVGIEINPRGLLYSLPGISGWVGSDLTAGILATGIHEKEELSLLVDIGTNGEIVIGNRDWMISTSASAGPALEGASEDCGMRAEKGAIEKVIVQDEQIRYETIGHTAPLGLCGSGIIDLVAVLLRQNIINRSGNFIDGADGVREIDGRKVYVLAEKEDAGGDRPIVISESDIENVITAKAAIFSAMKIILERVDLSFDSIDRLYLAGAFGNYINIDSAIDIGLVPNIPRDQIEFVGNTSIEGAKIVAFYKEALYRVDKIRESTTYYDLMGAPDYIDEFQKAMFLPHTDIELFHQTNPVRKT